METGRLRRLRWRMRGAWMWPAFIFFTALDAFLLDVWPIWGDGPRGPIAALLLAGFFNLACVALAAPLAARWLRRRRPDLPRRIATDYAGTALLALLALVIAVDGLAHQGQARERRRDAVAQHLAVAGYVRSQAPEHEPGLAHASSVRLGPDFYRTCIPGPDPRGPLCLFVETDQHPAGVTRDPDRTPNAQYQR